MATRLLKSVSMALGLICVLACGGGSGFFNPPEPIYHGMEPLDGKPGDSITVRYYDPDEAKTDLLVRLYFPEGGDVQGQTTATYSRNKDGMEEFTWIVPDIFPTQYKVVVTDPAGKMPKGEETFDLHH